MKEIEKADPKNAFLQQFEDAFGDDFLPKEWDQKKKDRVAAEVTPSRVKTGMVTSIPMICKGDKCVFKDTCKLYLDGDNPYDKPCPYEMGMVKVLMSEYVDRLEIDINDIVEYCQIRDLVNLEVQDMRAAKYLSKESFIQENIIGISGDGEPIFRKELHLAVELSEKTAKRKSQLLKQLAATREAKIKARTVDFQNAASLANIMDTFKGVRQKQEQELKDRLGIIDVDEYIQIPPPDKEE
jgi:hypothetical protein